MTSKHPPRFGVLGAFNPLNFSWQDAAATVGNLDNVDNRLQIFENPTQFGQVGFQGSGTSGIESGIALTKNQHTIVKTAVLTEGVWYVQVNTKHSPTGGTIQKRKCEIVTGQTTLQYGISFVENTVLASVNLFLPTSRIVSVSKHNSTTVNIIVYCQGGDSTSNAVNCDWSLHRIS